MSKSRDSYPDVEVPASSEMIYSVLTFLDASPLTIFVGAPDDGAEWVHFYEDIFKSLMGYLVADDERVRHLTNTVARKLMTDCSISLWRESQSPGSSTFISNFWKST
jgi:neurofibromin 1